MSAFVFSALLLLGCCAGAHAGPTPLEVALKVVATDPAPEGRLASQQSFYVQYSVATAEPVSASIQAWHRGQPVFSNLGSSAPHRFAGSGTAVASVFFWGERPTRIDEIRIAIADLKGTAMRDYAFPVTLEWTGKPAVAEVQAAPWVAAWRAAETERVKREVAQHNSARAPASDGLLIAGLTVGFLALAGAGLGLPLYAAVKWRGAWRTAAIAVGAILLIVLANIAVGVMRDRTSHNLAPFELVGWLGGAAALMIALCGARAVLQRQPARSVSPTGSDRTP